MAISGVADKLLKSLPPSIALEPDYFLFDFLSNYADKTSNETVHSRNDLLQQFTKYVIEDLDEKQFQKKKKDLERIFNNLLSKLKVGVIAEVNEILEFNWNEFKDFFNLLKHIRKSHERIIQWVIYYLFSSGEKEIEISKLTKTLEKFHIKNLEGLVKNVVMDAKEEGMKIEYVNSKIIIGHKPSDLAVKKCLANKLEFFSRRPRNSLDSEILELLDHGAYSNQEISEILDTDKSQVSKTMNKLQKSGDLKFFDLGARGFRYYTTDCTNCPFGTNFESCRRDSIEYIIKILKDEFDIRITADDLNQIEYNQSLLDIKRTLLMLKKNKKTKLDNETNRYLRKIFETTIQSSIKKQTTHNATKYVNLEPILEKTPNLFRLGFEQGTLNGINLYTLIMSRVDPELSKRLQRKEIQTNLLQELRKLRAIQ